MGRRTGEPGRTDCRLAHWAAVRNRQRTRWSACQNVQSQKFGQTANLFYPIISANREKSRDGKATELRCVFVLFRNFSHYVGRVATQQTDEKSRDAKLIHLAGAKLYVGAKSSSWGNHSLNDGDMPARLPDTLHPNYSAKKGRIAYENF